MSNDVNLTGDSIEAVAYALFRDVARAEGKELDKPGNGIDKKWITNTYEECMRLVKGSSFR
jgi:hypothetical protein